MSLKELLDELDKLNELIDGSVHLVEDAAKKAQELIYKAIDELLLKFEISDGRFIVNQDLTSRIALLEKKIEEILGDVYMPSIKEYLGSYKTIEQVNIGLHKSYNELEVDVELLSPARKTIYNNAKSHLTKGLAEGYIQPAKFLLMQHVTSGTTIKESQKVLREWNEGKTVGTIEKTVNLPRYAVQVARDSSYQYNGTIQEVIAKEYDLKKFIYTGDIIRDSRPLCVHLVNMDREIEYDELPKLLKQYPQGQIRGTNKDNFSVYRGGYACRHLVYPVK